ncbi:AAA family ATPase [Treponema sp.]|uniref:AAA family ATPase n=1 Tax=Treponema sp. TaxID=166 RepID=UPI0025D771CC|nr:AAA family ATPase [Treponema sp.]MBR4321338.1 ATP-binding protein [Treponema sp.]
MELIIDNIAKIKHAEIKLKGITVIAGNNDTGKSTVGKVLFSMFNSLNNIEDKLKKEKNATLERAFSSILRESLPAEEGIHNRLRFISRYSYNTSKIVNFFQNNFDKANVNESLVSILKSDFTTKTSANYTGLYEKIAEKILYEYERISKISDKDAMLTIVSRYFSSVFDNQICSLRNDSALKSSVELTIKGKKIKTTFLAGICDDITEELNITKKAIYIDNPFVLDDLQNSEFGAYVDSFLQLILLQAKDVVLEKGAYDAVDINDKLTDVENILNDIINGNVVEEDSDFVLQKEDFTEDIHLQNVSTGLKSFILLKLLLQNGLLTTKDILILDEPEIHLHPEWQLKYAETIVLLQKAFDLNIVITTHSATFLEAIDLFSQKHNIKDKCNYYLTENLKKNEQSDFEDVTESLDKVYKSLVTPTIALMRLREELESKNND